MPRKRSDSRLISAKLAFSNVVATLMEEMAITHDTYSDEEISALVRACVRDGFSQTWEEFLQWVMYGDDQKAKTIAEIRAGRGMWRTM